MIISYENNDSLTIFILISKTLLSFMTYCVGQEFLFYIDRAFNCVPLGTLPSAKGSCLLHGCFLPEANASQKLTHKTEKKPSPNASN